MPKEYIPAVEKGIRVQADTGVLAGFPTVDFKYTLVDGKYHDVDLSALAFEIAAKACFRDGMKKAGPIILEPIMDVEVTTPQDHVGDVVGDLNRRRGHYPEPGKLRVHRHRSGACAAEGDVRVYLAPAQHDQGARVVHDAVPSLRSGAAQRGGRDHEEERLVSGVSKRRGPGRVRAFFAPRWRGSQRNDHRFGRIAPARAFPPTAPAVSVARAFGRPGNRRCAVFAP